MRIAVIAALVACGSSSGHEKAIEPPHELPTAQGSAAPVRARVEADHLPTSACMDSLQAPTCANAAECVALGRKAYRDARSCGWDSLCDSANEPCKLAFVSFRAACRDANARGCYELAELAPMDESKLTGKPPDADARRRTQLLEDACDLGYGRGCYVLGDDHIRTPEGDAWYAKAVALYEPACAANDAEQCSLLGYNYIVGRGVPFDPAKGFAYFMKACDLGDGYGCDMAGQMLAEGKGAAKDLAQARTRYQRACELDPPDNGCARLGALIIDRGRGNVKQALPWFQKGCPKDAGDLVDCSACNALDDLCQRGIAAACGPQTKQCR